MKILDNNDENSGRIHAHYKPGPYSSNHDRHKLEEVAVFQSKIFVWPSDLT